MEKELEAFTQMKIGDENLPDEPICIIEDLDLTSEFDDIKKLIANVKTKEYVSSFDSAMKTIELLENLISKAAWENAKELMEMVKVRLTKLKDLLPFETTINNVLRHFLKIIRIEFVNVLKREDEDQPTLVSLVTEATDAKVDYSQPLRSLKQALLDRLAEYKTELQNSTDNIAAQAADHIHTNEILLTFGKSNTVEKFLIHASKTRKFQVIVAENCPSFTGRVMANTLADAKIQTTLISDAAVFAIMSRVNKVIIGAHTVFAEGGLRVPCGIKNVVSMARVFAVPVLCLVHNYKLSPVYADAYEEDLFNVYGNPIDILPEESNIKHKVNVINPVFDYVKPDFITLFILQQSGCDPTYIYHLLKELYHPDDMKL